jgi:hypothetical protein
MEKINRNLSVHFNSKLFTGIKHEDILSELEKEINLQDIKKTQKNTKINYQEKFSHILVGLLQYSINNYIIYWKFLASKGNISYFW